MNTNEIQLRDGDLCHAEIATDAAGRRTIVNLFPVMISRKLYDRSPLVLVSESLLPARMIAELSPADRVFGWVSQDANAGENPAYRYPRLATQAVGDGKHFEWFVENDKGRGCTLPDLEAGKTPMLPSNPS